MCEKRVKRVMKKGSETTRQREARRLQRLQAALPSPNAMQYSQSAQKIYAHKRFLIDIAWRTAALVHRNKLIQEKIIELQKETSDFVANIMSNPENQRRYIEHVQRLGYVNVQSLKFSNGNPIMPVPVILKLEPAT